MTASQPHIELEAVEFWVGDLDRVGRILARFGFEPDDELLEPRPDQESTWLASGNVRLALHRGTTPASPIAHHVARHGDGVGDIALVADDVAGIADRARAHRLKTSVEDTGIRIDLLGDGTILHSVRPRKGVPLPHARRRGSGSGMGPVDHLTYCLPFGAIEHVARSYRDVLGLSDVEVDSCGEAGDSVNGMRSRVLRSPLGFTVVLTEPMSPGGSGQTQHFLRVHAGAGVQHVAIACDDLPEVVRALRSRGVRFLTVPEEYLERSHRRLEAHALPWDALRREQILVDADRSGLLFQTFTRPVIDGTGFFFELVHRAGATGFGAGNVRALFAAVDASLREDQVTAARHGPSF